MTYLDRAPINKKRRQGLPPAAVCLLCIDQVIIDDLPCPDLDIIHSLHPLHRLLRLELLGDAFGGSTVLD